MGSDLYKHLNTYFVSHLKVVRNVSSVVCCIPLCDC